MKDLLSLLTNHDPIVVSERWKQRLSTPETSDIWYPESSYQRVPCPYCPQIHPVRVESHRQRYFFTCDIVQRSQILLPRSLRRWRMLVPRLLRHMAQQLGIHPHIAPLFRTDMWRLGTVSLTRSNTIVECWLCRRVSAQTLAWMVDERVNSDVVVLTLASTPFLRRICPWPTYVDLWTFVQDVQPYLCQRYFYQWCACRFQRVFFEPNNGDLWVDGKRLANITPSTAVFYFLQRLWDTFNVPVSHEDIFIYCCQQLAKRDGVEEWFSDYVPASFCHAMKREIKKGAVDQDMCHQIIQATRTRDGVPSYRLTFPND